MVYDVKQVEYGGGVHRYSVKMDTINEYRCKVSVRGRALQCVMNRFTSILLSQKEKTSHAFKEMFWVQTSLRIKSVGC